MNRFAQTAFALLAGFSALTSTSGITRAADLPVYIEQESGVCAESWVLRKITHRFRHQVTHVPQLPDVNILEFRGIHEHRYLPAQPDWPIGRRYCGATVALSDGQSRDIWYLIEEGMGFASIGNNVEFCVLGFDRWRVYNGACRVLR